MSGSTGNSICVLRSRSNRRTTLKPRRFCHRPADRETGRNKSQANSIVPKEVWYQVQAVLDAHKSAADATQVHDHYLKGTVYCGQCGERLIITNAKNRHGNVYPYFVCSGRHSGKTQCTRQAMLIEDVERLIEKYYEMIEVSPGMRQDLAGKIHADFDALMANETKELARLTSERDRLDDERMKLLQAHYAGAVPIDLLKQEQDRIANQIGDIQHRLEAHHDEYASARANLDDSLGLLANIVSVYERADDANRRLCNQAFFHRIFIEEEGDVRVEYERPFGSLCDTEEQMNALNWAAEAKKKGEVQTGQRVVTLVEGLNLSHLGWLTGLEPATSWTTTRCSTS